MSTSAPRQPQIQFARSSDETRIAYAVTGDGPPLVRASHWLGNLDFDWQTPVWGPWIGCVERALPAAALRLARLRSVGP